MNFGTVQAAFDAKLGTFTGAGQIVVQDGRVYQPTQGKPYLYGKMSGYAPAPAGVGADSPRQINGSYTITVYRPAAEGTAKATQIAAALVAMFARATVLAVGTSEYVQVTNSAEQLPMTAPDWITIPVVVSWFGTDLPAAGG